MVNPDTQICSDLSGMFKARSIALVGATERSFWSNIAYSNCTALGFKGDIHLVNRRGGIVYGRSAATSCESIGTSVDAALLMVPTEAIFETFDDLSNAGIRHAVILTSGFAEMGDSGHDRQAELVSRARKCGITLLGPNCLGFLNLLDQVPIWTSSLPPVTVGNVAIISQSGATASYIADFSAQQGVGIGYVISTGNEADLTVARAIDFAINDPRIKVVTAFIESARDTEILIAAAQQATVLGKAIIALKIGTSEVTAKAAQAHTGSLVGDDNVFTAACRQHGIIRVHSLEELVATAGLLSRVSPPARPHLGLAAISGGICEIASDRAGAVGAPLEPFAPETLSRLSGIMPEFGTAHNPLDVTGAAVLDPSIFERALGAIGEDPTVGMTAVIFDMPEKPEGIQFEVLKRVGNAFATSGMPGLVISTTVKTVSAGMQAVSKECRTPYLGCGVDLGIAAIANLFRWSSHLQRSPNTHHVDVQISQERPKGEKQTLAYLESQGVPVIPNALVTNEAEAADAAIRFGQPLAFKIASPDIQHKSDIGGVILNVEGDHVAREVFRTLIDRAQQHAPDAKLEGALVSPMRKLEIELFVGVLRDPQWGPIIMVGLGGIWVEALKDTSLRLLPVTPADVLEMLNELRATKLLDGFRGTQPVNRQAVAETIAAIGNAALALGSELVSLEVNPLGVSGARIEALDALVIWNND